MVDNLITQFAGNLNLPLPGNIRAQDLAKVGLGYFLGRRGGMVGDVAKMYAIFGARNIVAGFTSGLGLGATTAGSTTGATF
jgi:hypothetical protein